MFNAAFNTKQFWNGRAADLQEQAGGPPMNPIEMGSKDWDEILRQARAGPRTDRRLYRSLSRRRNGKNVTDAIAEYEKTLITPNSRFDKWLKGDDKALTAQEIEGYQRLQDVPLLKLSRRQVRGRAVLRIYGSQEGVL